MNGSNGKSLDDVVRVIRETPIGIDRSRPAVPTSPGVQARMDALREFAKNVDGARYDGWTNPVTGFGTTRDKSTYGLIEPDRILTDLELSALYHTDDLAARMVDIVPQEMFREGVVVETGDADADTAVADKFEALDVAGKYADGVRWGRCYGGGAVMIGADDGRDASLPLVPERASDVDFLYPCDKRVLWPASWYDEPGSPKLGQTKTYFVTTMGARSFNVAEVHESRLVLFGGAPTGIWEKWRLFGWDLSVLQRAHDVLRMFNTGFRAVETLMTDANQAVFKMSGLNEILRAAGGGMEELQARLQAMDLYRSAVRAIVVDADGDETFERQATSFAEIPNTLDKFMLRLAATVEIPVTILMAQSPAGMNATGESDFRWFYDRIRAKQKKEIAPKVRRLAQVWLATKAGRAIAAKVQALTVKFPPLWTETPLAQAQRELAIAQRDAVYVNAQVLQPDEVALQRFRPEGFSNEIALDERAQKARKASLRRDLDAIAAEPEAENATEAAPAVDPAAAAGAAPAHPEIPLAPTDLATVVKVNEARASVGLPHFVGPDGELTITAFKAKNAPEIAAAAQAEAGTDPNDPSPSAAANPFGGPPPPRPSGGPPNGEASPFEDKPNPFAKSADDEPTDEDVEAAGQIRADAVPRMFTLVRDEDETGVSGTGDVAHGCEFPDGRVALRWTTATASTTLFDSVEHVLKVHGHGGKTRIVWADEQKK